MKRMGTGGRRTAGSIPNSATFCCMTLGTFCNDPVPQSPRLSSGDSPILLSCGFLESSYLQSYLQITRQAVKPPKMLYF